MHLRDPSWQTLLQPATARKRQYTKPSMHLEYSIHLNHTQIFNHQTLTTMSFDSAVSALGDGCRVLGLPKAAASELLKFLVFKAKHDSLGQLGGKLFPSSTLHGLWQWLADNFQASAAVSELLGAPVEAPSFDHAGMCETDVLLRRLYSINVLEQAGQQPTLDLWQEPGCPPIIQSVGLPSMTASFTSPALTGQQQQQLAAHLQAYAVAAANDMQSSPEATEPYGMPWRISVPMEATSLRPAQTYAIRAVNGLTVRDFKHELLRQSYSAWSPMELRVFDGPQELFDYQCVPHKTGLRVMPPGKLSH